jgi:hypothetical protein
MCRAGQNHIYAPYMTVYFVISLLKLPYIHRIYIIYGSGQPYIYTYKCMVLANPRHVSRQTIAYCYRSDLAAACLCSTTKDLSQCLNASCL